MDVELKKREPLKLAFSCFKPLNPPYWLSSPIPFQKLKTFHPRKQVIQQAKFGHKGHFGVGGNEWIEVELPSG